ncbi:type II toxin-antitoxin system PemK/MazF family toxin [Bacillus inaquosorum]|uniref:type II toxin-antitoxin system PemK/MazF family toxin n=1 Tax=Bacillus inaquosorum TaxID=483913 RepID=UPI002E23A7D0|nr:type II toxin-antitoxin system PemK/MazF family toxin [Bacillus inaquosorum]MED1173705.1 type II toxin-antitoxin system PemK/MazF family toxin [Bacillus inaquosorum]MED1540951.1 type II toxin-antitoxin system PemK/MazF family toxin [Bacillus inaquosorum]
MEFEHRDKLRRGSIFLADLDPALGAEKSKKRRVLIISNDLGNSNPLSPVVIAVPITSEVTEKRKKMPMYVELKKTVKNGQTKDALIDCFQIRVLDIEKRLSEYIGIVDAEIMKKVDAALETCLQIKTCPKCSHVLMPNKKHCVNCKTVLIKICTSCTKEISSEFKFCPHCGNNESGGTSNE